MHHPTRFVGRNRTISVRRRQHSMVHTHHNFRCCPLRFHPNCRPHPIVPLDRVLRAGCRRHMWRTVMRRYRLPSIHPCDYLRCINHHYHHHHQSLSQLCSLRVRRILAISACQHRLRLSVRSSARPRGRMWWRRTSALIQRCDWRCPFRPPFPLHYRLYL